MRHLDLFSGIGGFALALETAFPDEQIEHIFCENEPFAQVILKKHWPNATIYGDIRQLTTYPDSERKLQQEGSQQEFREWVGDGVDILTGGFPCQPFSAAGRRLGTEDNRHLWPEMLRVIRETNPLYVVGENVGGLLTWDGGLVFEQVCTDLEEAGYEVAPFVIPAASLNAPHRRDRVWIVAHASGGNAGGTPRRFRGTQGTQRLQERDEMGELGKPSEVHDTDSISAGLEGRERDDPEGYDRLLDRNGSDERWDWSQDWYEVATRFCRVDDGIPRRLDRSPRLKALGNAIVPQVAAQVLYAMITTNPTSEFTKTVM